MTEPISSISVITRNLILVAASYSKLTPPIRIREASKMRESQNSQKMDEQPKRPRRRKKVTGEKFNPKVTSWALKEKKALYEALKRFSPTDIDILQKQVKTKTKTEISDYIRKLQTMACRKNRLERSDWTPIEHWMALMKDLTAKETMDYSKSLGRVLSIAGNFEDFPVPSDSSPNYRDIYNYLSALLLNKDLPNLGRLESLVILDQLHNLVDVLRTHDTSEQRKIMQWKYRMLAAKVDMANPAEARVRAVKAMENDFTDSQGNSAGNVSSAMDQTSADDHIATRENTEATNPSILHGPSPVTTDPQPGPSPVTTDPQPGPSPVATDPQPGPSPVATDPQPGPSPVTTDPQPGPSPVTTDPQPGPSPVTTDPQPGPSPVTTDPQPGPSPVATDPQPGPSPVTTDPQPGPSPVTTDPQPGPSPVATDPQPGPSPVTTGPQPGPSPVNTDSDVRVHEKRSRKRRGRRKKGGGAFDKLFKKPALFTLNPFCIPVNMLKMKSFLKNEDEVLIENNVRRIETQPLSQINMNDGSVAQGSLASIGQTSIPSYRPIDKTNWFQATGKMVPARTCLPYKAKTEPVTRKSSENAHSFPTASSSVPLATDASSSVSMATTASDSVIPCVLEPITITTETRMENCNLEEQMLAADLMARITKELLGAH